MIQITAQMRVLVAIEPVDERKEIDSPVRLCQDKLADDPFSKCVFVLRNIRFVAYNTRFLILPWVRVKHLASQLLGRMAARISEDWQRMSGHPIYLLETFADPARFRGTCYRAANWVLLGKTTGRGKQPNSYVPNRSIKEVLGYPLSKLEARTPKAMRYSTTSIPFRFSTPNNFSPCP